MEQAINFIDAENKALREEQKILERRDPQTFTDTIVKRFEKVLKYKEPLIFEKVQDDSDNKKIFICTEGEIGAGKSSSNNYFIYEYSKMNGNIDYKDKTFKFGRQCERVTTQVNQQVIGGLTVMDTPGTNDIKSELSDYDINKMK